MKKFLSYAFCLMLCGCLQYPIYRSHTQEIYLPYIPGAKVYYDGEEQTDKVELFRSWFDKELVIKKEGFKDYHLKLESEWTDDAWAERQTCVGMCGGGPGVKEISFPELIIPYNTVVSLPFFIYLPWEIASDIWGIISIPVLPLWNPWREYKGDSIFEDNRDYLALVTPALEPTDELKESCNKKGYFISNFGCTKCNYGNKVVASKEESDKCSNRFYDSKKKLSYSCFDTGERIDADSCGMCENRKMFGEVCVLNCPADKPLQDENGSCYSCDEGYRVKTKECSKCSNRYVDKNGYCRLCEGTASKDGKSCIN